MALTDVLTAIGTVITSAVGWATTFLAQFTTANGWFVLPLLLGFALYGLHILKSLMGR